MFLGHSACLNFSKKNWKLRFDPCINAFHLRPFLGFIDTRTTFYDQNIFILPKKKRDFSKVPGRFTPGIARPNRGRIAGKISAE